jgi:hypothetical protein
VTRATTPDSSATKRPAMKPPMLMDTRERPEMRKPMAAPGSTAWDMESPIKLIRRNTSSTPTGPQPMESAAQATSARRMKAKSRKGAASRS